MNKFAQWTLNIAGGVFFFFFFLFLFFPFDSIIRHYLSVIETQSKGEYRITVGEIDANIIFKSVLKDFQIHQSKDGQDLIILDVPEMRIGVSYLPLIAGNVSASFLVKGHKGEMDGDLYMSQSEVRLELDIEQINFSEVPYLAKLLHIPFEGTLDGKVDLELYSDQISKNEGEINLVLKNIKIPAGKIEPYPGFGIDLPEAVLAGSNGGVLKAKMSKGKLEISDLSFPGEDIKMSVNGRIQLNKRINLSRIAINGSFQFSKKLEEAFPFLLLIEKQKNEEGWYPFTLSGRFSSPRFQIGTFKVL